MTRRVRLSPFEYGWAQGSAVAYGVATPVLLVAAPSPWWASFTASACLFAVYVLRHSYIAVRASGDAAAGEQSTCPVERFAAAFPAGSAPGLVAALPPAPARGEEQR